MRGYRRRYQLGSNLSAIHRRIWSAAAVLASALPVSTLGTFDRRMTAAPIANTLSAYRTPAAMVISGAPPLIFTKGALHSAPPILRRYNGHFPPVTIAAMVKS